jgi:hypothetical protein
LNLAEVIASLPGLPGPDLEKLETALLEEKARRAAAGGEKSLTEELDALSVLLARQMDRVLGCDLAGFDSALCRELVVVLPGGRYPLLAVVGYRKHWPCEYSRYCREKDAASCWPEVLGVKPWDWPWQPVEAVTHGNRDIYLRGFVLSFAPMEKAGVALVVHVNPRYTPHQCSAKKGDYPNSRSTYFIVGRSPDGVLRLEGTTWANYRRACILAASLVPELAAAQERSVQKTAK